MRNATTLVLLSLLAAANGSAHGQPATDAAPPARQPAGTPPPPGPSRDVPAKRGETLVASRSIALDRDLMANSRLLEVMVARAAAEHGGVLGVPEGVARALPEIIKVGENMSGAEWINLVADLRTAQEAKPRPRAGEFIDAVLASLERQVGEWHAERAGVDRAARDVAEARAALDELRAAFRNVEHEIRQTTGRADVSVEAIRASVPKLDEERQTLKLQVIGKEARQAALAATIERLAKAAAERASGDPVAAELQKVVDAREQAVKMNQAAHEAASVSAREVADAEAVLAEARARLLERRDAVARASGGELLEALNRELATLSIDAAESQAKLAALDALLAKYVDAEELLGRADDVRRERQRREDALRKAESRLAEARASLPERVIRVLDGYDMAPDDPRLKENGAGDEHDDNDAPGTR
jgi:hypothetical protein